MVIHGIATADAIWPFTGPSIGGKSVVSEIQAEFNSPLALSIKILAFTYKDGLIESSFEKEFSGKVEIHEGEARYKEHVLLNPDRLIVGGEDILTIIKSQNGQPIKLDIEFVPFYENRDNWGSRKLKISGPCAVSRDHVKIAGVNLIREFCATFPPDENGFHARTEIRINGSVKACGEPDVAYFSDKKVGNKDRFLVVEDGFTTNLLEEFYRFKFSNIVVEITDWIPEVKP